ncbi:RimK family alpha-L-glutamate ligase [Streptacidiphilus sp. P02-A3a]|uniref:ATP-grasp domain-containing protein n=1 Tax=Streptacidiphilus sp. P02-A3a TaxID=2704468 RepID=UPI0015FAD669|nr:hypothetical protein [Streptacidiphilus sp. P02-A3a]QMU73984.1 hypothetical protein GXP74_23535 [Streptacidiphilus sp. P02-A3a]
MELLLAAVTAAGARAEAVAWDEAEADWAGYDLAVIRSSWDYTWRWAEFTAWADRCAGLTRLGNPPSVLRWSGDKSYLGELRDRGVPVVPTRYLRPGEEAELPRQHEFVVKPILGAGARFAARYRPDQHQQAREQLRQMHAEGLTAMVQPYMHRIAETGERALVFVGGRLLHTTRKEPVLAPGVRFDERKTAHPGIRLWSPTESELALAEQALAAVPGAAELLYARVDVVDDDQGAPVVTELELVEPNLFLHLRPAAARTAAEAFVAAAGLG